MSVVFASNAFVITNDCGACQGIPRTPGYTERCDYLNGLIMFLLGTMTGGLVGVFFMCLFIAGGNAAKEDEMDAPPK